MLRLISLVSLALVLFAGTVAQAQTPTDICDDPNASDDATITACTQVIQSGVTGQDLAYAYNNRGTGYLGKGQLELALADFNKALSLDPTDPQAYNNRGEVYYDKGLLDSAIADYTKAIEIKSDYAHAYGNRGKVYYRLGSYDRAISDFGSALALDPKYELPYRLRGYSLIGQGNYSAAVADLQHEISLVPKYAYPVLWLHVARMRSGQSDASELQSNAATLDAVQWPAKIVSFYLGKSTPASVIASATTNDQRCEAYFYVGQWQVAHQQAAAARVSFQHAQQLCRASFYETPVTRSELSRL